MGDLLDDASTPTLSETNSSCTMSMLIPPQMMNTMVPAGASVRRRPRRSTPIRPPLHAPGGSDRLTEWTSHPYSSRDCLHEHDMWVGRRPDPPLSDQGARRAALHLPAVLRPLHADGPGRQLTPQVDKLKFRSRSRSTATTR